MRIILIFCLLLIAGEASATREVPEYALRKKESPGPACRTLEAMRYIVSVADNVETAEDAIRVTNVHYAATENPVCEMKNRALIQRRPDSMGTDASSKTGFHWRYYRVYFRGDYDEWYIVQFEKVPSKKSE